MSDSHNHHHAAAEAQFIESNRSYWDKSAATYAKDQWQKDMINKVHGGILEHISWLGVPFLDPSSSFEADPPSAETNNQVRVLDYACGPGTITNILLGHATEFIGIDVSQNMVNEYNRRFTADEGTDTSTQHERVNAHATVGNLLAEEGVSHNLTSSSTFTGFDLAVVGFGFHHFANLPLATRRLVERLRPGGVLLIVDFVAHAKFSDQHGSQATIAHHGFGEKEVHEIFGGAGLVDIDVRVLEGDVEMKLKGPDHPGQKRRVFLGKGKKPA